MSTHKIRVWDLPVRLTHWALVACVIALYATGEYGWLSLEWHFRFGYLLLALVLFRLVWGLVGSEHARFADFVRGPRSVIAYVRNWNRGEQPHKLGHNPLGALAIVAMLALLLTQAISGLFSNDEIEWYGPLSERISVEASAWWTDWHHLIQKLLLALIVLHLLAIAAYRFIKRDNLITPMLTGRKSVESGTDARWRSPWLALLIFLICMSAVWALTVWGPPASG